MVEREREWVEERNGRGGVREREEAGLIDGVDLGHGLGWALLSCLSVCLSLAMAAAFALERRDDLLVHCFSLPRCII